MVQTIRIENFRCFQDFNMKELGRVNLIGGKNNSGKTALLEALLLGNMPVKESVDLLQRVRMENVNYFRLSPDTAWSNIFVNMDKSQKVQISIGYLAGSLEVRIKCDETSRKKKEIKKALHPAGSTEELIKIEDSAELVEITESKLTINAQMGRPVSQTSISYKLNELKPIEVTPTTTFSPILNTLLVPAGFKKTPGVMAREFDKAAVLGKKEAVLEGLRIIDDAIDDVMTISLGEPRIHIVKDGKKPQPLNFYGDALNKVVDILLRILNNPECLILIDEIENGIHHSNHKEFWSLLFKLTARYKVQIFATSHSAEMISAFQAAAIEGNYQEDVRYFEMFRSARTQQIVANNVQLETLGYQIQTDQPYRGE